MTIASHFVASALGVGNAETLANYRRGVAPGMKEIAGDIPSRSIFFGMVPGELPEIEEPKWNMRSNRLIKLAVENMPMIAAAMKRWTPERVGVVIGASNTGIDEAQGFVDEWLEQGKKPKPMDFSMIELGTPSSYLKLITGVKGPAYTISTACSSATKAFASAKRLLESGRCDAVITGGVDGRCRFAMNGFHALGALSAGRCKPLAEDRDGINLGEGVALFVMTKNATGQSSLNLVGVGESSDAYHATAPDPEGFGAEASMRLALADARLDVKQVDYINLHGTGTQANDAMEMKAVHRLFGSSLPRLVESTKNLTGHCLGAAGAVEAAICCLKLEAGECQVALSNSFAFGGANASAVFTR